MKRHLFTRVGCGLLALVAAGVLPSNSSAQLLTPDPYNPFGRSFASFAYPGAGFNPSLPNHVLYGFRGFGPDSFPGSGTVNPFQRPLDEPGVPTSRITRYDAAFRAYDEGFRRSSTPNQDADNAYFDLVARRDDAYFQMLRERDPKKRETLKEEYDKLVRQVAKELATSRRTARSAIPDTAANRNSSRPPRNESATAERDSTLAVFEWAKGLTTESDLRPTLHDRAMRAK